MNFQTHLKEQIPFDLDLHYGMGNDISVENFSVDVMKAQAASTTK